MRVRTLLPFVIFAAASAFFPVHAAAVQTVPERKIPREPSCPRCSIVVGSPRTFGNDDGPGSLEGYVWGGARDSKGNYYIVAGPNAPPLKFDSGGRFVTRIGVMGPGPGEFQGLSTITVVNGDSVYVADARSVHVFAPNGAFVRTDALPVVVRIPVIRRDGSAVVAGALQTAAGVGAPFHFLGRGMETITRSFGNPVTGSPSSAPVPGHLGMAERRDRGFWVVDVLEYRLTEWDSTGTPRQVLVGDPAWWVAPTKTSRRDTVAVPPQSGIRRVYEDPAGLLWVATHVPGARWREGWGPRQPGGGYLITGIRFDLLYDTMIEVIDPRSARLLTSVRVPGYVSEFLGPDEILQTTEDTSGVPWALVRKIRLNRSPGGQ